MALYALDREELISADDALHKKAYCCLECRGALQVRQGRRRRHFYHVKTSPQCRLYSKSEAHLLLQLQVQNKFCEGEIVIERPFPSIGRIADLCWDRCKIIFEIQCSFIAQKEAEERMVDYASLGYTVIWLLDDRRFNRRHLSPTELFLRNTSCYYIHYQKTKLSLFYDQFELIQQNRRLRTGIKLPVFLTRPRTIPQTPLLGEIPEQIKRRQESWRLFFEGDLFHKALLSQTSRSIAISMQNWAIWQKNIPLLKQRQNPSRFLQLFYRLLEWLIRKANG